MDLLAIAIHFRPLRPEHEPGQPIGIVALRANQHRAPKVPTHDRRQLKPQLWESGEIYGILAECKKAKSVLTIYLYLRKTIPATIRQNTNDF
jgi:hypothetical protein